MNIWIAIVMILMMALVFTVGGFFLRLRLYRGLSAQIARGEAAAALERLEGFWARAVLSPYARERLCFLALAGAASADAAGTKDLVASFNALMKLQLQDAQRAEALSDGFHAFAARRDSAHVRRILQEMKQGGFTAAQLAAYRRHADVVCLGCGERYRTQLESTYATLSGRRRGYAAYLLASIYGRAHDERAAAMSAEAQHLLGLSADTIDRSIHVCTTF